jgi:hypothetical protein
MTWWAGSVLVLGGGLVVAWRHGRLGVAFACVSVLLAGAWGAARWMEVHSARSWGDCYPACTAAERAVPLGYSAPPVAFIALGVLAAALAAVSGPRGREWKPLSFDR